MVNYSPLPTDIALSMFPYTVLSELKFLDNSAILSLYALVLSTESLRFETKSLIPA
jgi:hypothetical protein